METAALYEVSYTSPGHDAPTRTVTDAAGVTDLVRQAAAAGTRVHVRPLADEVDYDHSPGPIGPS
jgi:hypothetical protein